MNTAVFIRPVEGYAAKLVLDQAIAERRHDLDRWSFTRGIYVSHSVFGSLQSGFSEFVSLTTHRDNPDPCLVAQALAQANQTVRATQPPIGTPAPRPRPRGFSRLLVADQDFDECQLPHGAYEPLRTWRDVERRAVNDPPRLETTEAVADGRLCILGRAWPLHSADLRSYLSVRLLEHMLGSTEESAALRPLRDNGDAYAAVGRFVYDLGVLVVAVLGSFATPLATHTQLLLDSVRPTTEQLDAAKRDFWFQFSLGQSASGLHALAPFALLDPSVSAADLRQLVDEIRLDEVAAILTSNWVTVRRVLDEHGLV